MPKFDQKLGEYKKNYYSDKKSKSSQNARYNLQKLIQKGMKQELNLVNG